MQEPHLAGSGRLRPGALNDAPPLDHRTTAHAARDALVQPLIHCAAACRVRLRASLRDRE